MNLYRPVNGIYYCVNNPQDTRRYVLKKGKGFYPALVPIDEKHFKKVPFEEFSSDDTTARPIGKNSGK